MDIQFIFLFNSNCNFPLATNVDVGLITDNDGYVEEVDPLALPDQSSSSSFDHGEARVIDILPSVSSLAENRQQLQATVAEENSDLPMIDETHNNDDTVEEFNPLALPCNSNIQSSAILSPGRGEDRVNDEWQSTANDVVAGIAHVNKNGAIAMETRNRQGIDAEKVTEVGMGENFSNKANAVEMDDQHVNEPNVDDIDASNAAELNITENHNNSANDIGTIERNMNEPNASLENSAEFSSEFTPDVELKPDPLHFVVEQTGNESDIDELLEETEEIVHDSDVTIYVGQDGIPKPMSTTTDNLVKRENDPMSGAIPFDEKVIFQIKCFYQINFNAFVTFVFSKCRKQDEFTKLKNLLKFLRRWWTELSSGMLTVKDVKMWTLIERFAKCS